MQPNDSARHPPFASGRRRFTEADLRAQRAIEAYDAFNGERPSKSEVLGAFKRAYRALGLDARIVHSIDQLCAFSREIDWTDGPIIVWPSNERLKAALGVEERALRNRLARLKELGLIAFADSPTGARWGTRDAEGRIEEAYGIDLRPLAQRYEEFAELAAQGEEEARARKALRRRRTIARKKIEQIAAAALEYGGDAELWSKAVARARALAEETELSDDVALLGAAVDRLEACLQAAEAMFGALSEGCKGSYTAGPAAVRRPHITTTELSVFRKNHCRPDQEEKGGRAQEIETRRRCGTLDQAPQERGPGEEPPTPPQATLWSRETTPSAAEAVVEHLETYQITPERVLAASKPVRDVAWVDDRAQTAEWRDVVDASRRTAQSLGVSRWAWGEACRTLSAPGAAVAIAVIAEKHRRGAEGEGPRVAQPGGYLRWFAKAAQSGGAIDLGPKIYGLGA